MSSIPLITHRMLAAVAAQERRHDGETEEDQTQWSQNGLATVEVLDPSEWASAPSPEIPRVVPAPAALRDDQ